MKRELPTKLEIKKYDVDFGECFKMAAIQLHPKTEETIIRSLAIQISRLEESKQRIDIEGIVVRDLKGSVISHPAIKIEQDATKLIADMVKKFKHFC